MFGRASQKGNEMDSRWQPVDPAQGWVDYDWLEQVRSLCRTATEQGKVPGLALAVARHGKLIVSEAFGTRGRFGSEGLPATTDTIWLVASVTKPVVCAALCRLMEAGELLLDDPVSRHLEEFSGEDRRGVTIRHLLTHTSGLPDMLPENLELRAAHAPLEEFVRRICHTPLLFEPGTQIRYQSTGIALLAAVLERRSGRSCREFLRQEFFEPLGMEDCSLGWQPDRADRLAIQGLDTDPPTNWDWNSNYWREFGAPWGGMFATAPQMALYLQMLMSEGHWDGRRYLQPATVRAIIRDQTAHLPTLPEAERRRSAWGLGWRVNSAPDSEYFGDLLSTRAYGHAGATGTVVWNDPETATSCVLFSNRPGSGRFLGRVSNAVAGLAV